MSSTRKPGNRSSTYSMVRPEADTRGGVKKDLKSLEDFSRVLADLIDQPDVATSVVNMSRERSRSKFKIASLSGVVSLLIAAIGVLVSYIQGYADSRVEENRVVMERAELEKRITEHLANPGADLKDTIESIRRSRDVALAAAVLQIEQQSYAVLLTTATVSRKKPPEKPPSLIIAEIAVRARHEQNEKDNERAALHSDR